MTLIEATRDEAVMSAKADAIRELAAHLHAANARLAELLADFTVDVTDQLKLSIGGRYTYDQRSAYILRQNYVNGGSPVFGSAGTDHLPTRLADGEQGFPGNLDVTVEYRLEQTDLVIALSRSSTMRLASAKTRTSGVCLKPSFSEPL